MTRTVIGRRRAVCAVHINKECKKLKHFIGTDFVVLTTAHDIDT